MVLFVELSGFFRLLFERRKKRSKRFAFGFLGALLPFQLMKFLGIFLPLTGKVCQCFTKGFRILQPCFLPFAIAEQEVGSRKGLSQLVGLFFYSDFFPLLPAGGELLLADHLLTGSLAICKFFMELKQLLLQTGKMAGMGDVGFFFIR